MEVIYIYSIVVEVLENVMQSEEANTKNSLLLPLPLPYTTARE